MPRQSETGNVKKRCACGRPKWAACAHPWFVDYKAPKTHRRRANERYRRNIDQLIGSHVQTLSEAKDEARRAITAWLDGKDPADLQGSDRPTLKRALEEYAKRPDAAVTDAWQIKPITTAKVQGRPFGEWRIADITREALDAFQRQRPRVGGNRNLALLRSMFNWAVVAGLVESSPFKIGGVAVIKLRAEMARTRRLQAGEEERLLLTAGGLHDLIIAALETGCRRGELLSLQWHQVRFEPRAELFLPAQKTKAKKDRRVPLTGRLVRLLAARRSDPAGDPLPAEAFVFGDEIGRRRVSIKTAWGRICKDAKTIGLHFHDLRREAGSRWMDAGVPLATIQRWLGHANISQTSTYLAASLGGDESAIMAAFEQKMGRGEPAPAASVPQSDISEGVNGDQPTRSDGDVSEKTQQNPIVH
jgi:integrase